MHQIINSSHQCMLISFLLSFPGGRREAAVANITSLKKALTEVRPYLHVMLRLTQQ